MITDPNSNKLCQVNGTADQGARELPPLPEKTTFYTHAYGPTLVQGYTSAQMREYALTALAAAPSQGAKEAEPAGRASADSEGVRE